MLSSALGTLTDRLDSKFLAAYWLPAFVAVMGGLGLLAALVGRDLVGGWIAGLDAVEQGWAALILLLTMTMLAFVLRALTGLIAELFSGAVAPRVVAAWARQGQRARKQVGDATARQHAGSVDSACPIEDAATRPTRLGDVLAGAADHPQLAYAMHGRLWWPRLAPLLPSAFREMLAGALTPLMALLNLSVVFCTLALTAIPVLGVLGGQWRAALPFVIGGSILAWLCYRAAVSQAVELGSLYRVAFDLYRHEILRLWCIELPMDQTAERALWQRLTRELLGTP